MFEHILFAIGWLDLLSKLCNISKFSLENFPSTTVNFPCVIVPVLSNTIVSTLWSDSNVSLDFISMPFLLHVPIDTTIASGVARPRAQGHATTSTLTNATNAFAVSFVTTKFNIKDKIAITKIVGTKYPLILSANLWILVFVLVASITIFTILEMLESFPILSAVYSIYPS